MISISIVRNGRGDFFKENIFLGGSMFWKYIKKILVDFVYLVDLFFCDLEIWDGVCLDSFIY